jgi:hypothetical protein
LALSNTTTRKPSVFSTAVTISCSSAAVPAFIRLIGGLSKVTRQ